MLLADSEAIALQLVAIGLIAAFLLMLADTPAYPLAIGVEIIALLYILLEGGGTAVVQNLTRFAVTGSQGQ